MLPALHEMVKRQSEWVVNEARANGQFLRSWQDEQGIEMPVNIGHGGVVGWRDGGPQQGKDFVIVFLSNLQVGKCSLQDLCTDTQSWTGMKMTQHRNYGGILLIFKLHNPPASKLKFKRRKQSQIISLWYKWIAIFCFFLLSNQHP